MKAFAYCIALCLPLATTLCLAAEPQPYRALLAHCKGLDNTFRCARAIEASQAKGATRKHFERVEKTLRVNSALGPIEFLDDDTEGDTSIHYSYLTYLPAIQLHVLHVQYWEGNVYMVVHQRSGATTKEIGRAHV